MRAQFKTSPPLILHSTNCGLTNSCRKNEALRDKRVDKEAGENPSPASQCPVHHPAPFTGKLGPGSATQLVQKCNIQHFLVVRHWNVTSRTCAPGSLHKVLLKVLPIRRKMPGVKPNAVEQRSLRIETVGSFLVTTLLIFSVAVPSAAQQTIKILPPLNNSCTTFIGAMESGDPDKLAVLASWALGYVSGIALGTGVDVLRGLTGPDVVSRLYSDCKKQPGRALSVTVEEMAHSLITEQH